MLNNLNICLSGLTSCGKTSHANFISEQYGIPRTSASELLIKKGRESKLHDVDFDNASHPWLGDFDAFNNARKKDISMDRAIDRRILEIMNTAQGIVVESLTLPRLAYQEGLSSASLLIYLHASHRNRIGRAYVSGRTKTLEELDIGVSKKDKISQGIIQDLWCTDILNMSEQFSYNDVVLNTDETDNGDPHDASNVHYGKETTRIALVNILDMTLGRQNGSDELKRIADQHPTFFTKLPENIWIAIQ